VRVVCKDSQYTFRAAAEDAVGCAVKNDTAQVGGKLAGRRKQLTICGR
jgi:hypothetical protein